MCLSYAGVGILHAKNPPKVSKTHRGTAFLYAGMTVTHPLCTAGRASGKQLGLKLSGAFSAMASVWLP